MGARSAVLFFARREAVGSETKPGEGGCNERKLEKVPVKEEIAEVSKQILDIEEELRDLEQKDLERLFGLSKAHANRAVQELRARGLIDWTRGKVTVHDLDGLETLFDERLAALEKEGVLVSLENLMTFPFVKEAVESGKLTLHGLWTDIGAGGLESYDPERGAFVPL